MSNVINLTEVKRLMDVYVSEPAVRGDVIEMLCYMPISSTAIAHMTFRADANPAPFKLNRAKA